MEENNVQTKLHEKKWFLPVLFVVIILSNIIGVAIMMAMPMFTFKMGGALMSKTTSWEKAEKINLKELKLGSKLGRLPKGNKGQISSNNEKELILNIPNITPKDYEEYIKQCRKNFNIDERLVSGSFEAYDKDNYRLMLDYYEQNKILLMHSPYLADDKVIKEELKEYDLVLAGHMHNGLVPSFLDDEKNDGIVSPYKEMFCENARGYKILSDNSHLIITGGLTKIAGDSNLQKFLNNLYPVSIDKIAIRKDAKKLTLCKN